METVKLKINGNYVEGLSGSSVKLTVNNISPVTMTGDSVAFSATIKVPRTLNNDRTFINLQKGMHECIFYDCQLLVHGLPFRYMDYDVNFYAKVSYNGGNYNISLVENTKKWSDEEIKIQNKLVQADQQFATWWPVGNRVVNLEKIITAHVTWKEGKFPPLTPRYNDGSAPSESTLLCPSIMINRGTISWDSDVASGNMSLVPKEFTKGRGGYIYPGIAQVVLSDTTKALYATLFGNTINGNYPGFNLKAGVGGQVRVIVEYTGSSVPSVPPVMHLVAETTNLTGAILNFDSKITDRIWLYKGDINGVVFVTPKSDKYMIVKGIVSGSKVSCFKFPDGYAPEELVDVGEGAAEVLSQYRPAAASIHDGRDFPYSDVKKMVDDLCTMYHWRKYWRNGVLSIEPIIHRSIRDKESDRSNYLVDWSGKFVSVDTVEVPDEFGDQFVTQLGDVKYSYSAGPGTLNPVKDAYKSGIPFSYNALAFPKAVLTSKFNGGTAAYVTPVEDIYRKYIERHFKLFTPRMQVKIKARLTYQDVINLKLDRAYYFSQLGGYFYLKSLGEYDVNKGDCKLSLYKLDLTS